ncbi:MAG: WxL domain-containing protein, partial [Vagococcus sp.]
SSMLSIAVLSMGGLVAHGQADYESATKVNGYGEISFGKGDTVVVDPIIPDVPVDPGEVNPSGDDLRIQYVSDFIFPQTKKSVNEVTSFAKGDSVDWINPDTGKKETKSSPLFISTVDMRTERGSGWTLSVKPSEFTSQKDQHVIEGGHVILSDAHYANSQKAQPIVNSDAANKESGLALKPGETFKIAGADSSKNEGQGSWSLAFGGQDKELKSTGVMFKMGPDTAVESNVDYTATFVWNLSPNLAE